MMTEPITLNLTLKELKLIDKYVEYNEETKEVFGKIFINFIFFWQSKHQKSL